MIRKSIVAMTTTKLAQSSALATENDAAVNAPNGAHFVGKKKTTTRRVKKVKATDNKNPFRSRTSIPSKAAKHEAGNAYLSDSEGFHEAILAADREISTEETASDIISSINSTVSSDFGQYEVIEYDLNDPASTDSFNYSCLLTLSPTSAKTDKKMISELSNTVSIPFPDLDLVIQDDSPAAEALRANANVHVSSAGKAARAVHLQSIRRLAKFAAGANKTGYVKGKPPRLPPTHRQKMEGPFGGPPPLHSLREDISVDDDDSEDRFRSSHPAKDNVIEREINEDQLVTEKASDDNDSAPDINIDGGNNQNHEANSEIPPTALQDIDEKVARRNDENQHQNQHHVELPTPVAEQKERFHSPEKANAAAAVLTGAAATTNNGVAPGTIEAGKKVLGNVDPHDLLKLQRYRKKNTGQSQLPKSYVKGKVIDGEHELYTLSIAVMIGVRQSISRTNVELNQGAGKRWVRIQDFRAAEKYEFRPKGDGPTPPHLLAHTFKFKDYCPVVFAYLRRMYGVNEFDFLLSVCGNANFIEFISNAKSGQFFFYSSDGRYMIKTMTNAESKFLRRILPLYFKHCAENPNTMMTRFFGMYRVKLYHLRRNVKFVIMNSVYYTDKHLQSFYDLKGSSLGRDAKPGQAVLKDNDLRRSLPDGALAIKTEQLASLRYQIRSDCEFLQQMDIMDYSMLVGVHYVPPAHRRRSHTHRTDRKLRGSDGSVENFQLDSAVIKSMLTEFETSDSARNEFSPLLSKPSHRRKLSLRNLSFDDGLDDDDSSYLLGSTKNPNSRTTNIHVNEDTERKKRATIEKLYWPFHHWFDIHGHRRLTPLDAPYNSFSDEDKNILKGYNIPTFVEPSSDRKDGGFEMDLTGMRLPLTIKEPSGETKVCEGKIFFMGIIDILQEYNARKSIETTYRSLFFSSRGGAPSSVPPRTYADRFIDFFEEYTRRTSSKQISIIDV